ncbi:hypothetical protein ACFL6T_04190 [Candidatus Zixiibacteriota bacterium]
MELRIDVNELLEQVLNEAEPGEDVDEAIFRTCKKRYPDHFMEIFPALLQVVEQVEENVEGSGIEMIRNLVASDHTVTINLHTSDVIETRIIDGDAGEIVKDLPESLRKKIGDLLKRDAVRQSTEKTVIRRTSLSGKEILDCRCGFLGPADDERCPKCGRTL